MPKKEELERMKMEGTLAMFKNAEKNHDLSGILRTLDAECRNCAPLNPLECITRCNVWKLKNELKRAGYSHSQETITEEYLRPLLDVGLAAEAQDQYYATTFGGRLTELLGDFPEFVEILPAHSECYEETLLNALSSGPKTFEDVGAFVSRSEEH